MIMKKQLVMLFLAAGTLLCEASFNLPVGSSNRRFATCKGENPCRACKNWKYCKRVQSRGWGAGFAKNSKRTYRLLTVNRPDRQSYGCTAWYAMGVFAGLARLLTPPVFGKGV
jgi:hypothetical protein